MLLGIVQTDKNIPIAYSSSMPGLLHQAVLMPTCLPDEVNTNGINPVVILPSVPGEVALAQFAM